MVSKYFIEIVYIFLVLIFFLYFCIFLIVIFFYFNSYDLIMLLEVLKNDYLVVIKKNK